MHNIQKYFPNLTEQQIHQFSRLEALYLQWNEKINVISRKDTKYFYTHHVLHALSIAQIIQFSAHTQIMDLGTGGGFPGIPLAILFPTSRFFLVDSIAKKIKVVQDIIDKLALKNTTAICSRAEDVNRKFDFVVSRAVSSLADFIKWTESKIDRTQKNTLNNGWICLKGGDLTREINEIRKKHKIIPIADFFDEDFFETKKIIYVEN